MTHSSRLLVAGLVLGLAVPASAQQPDTRWNAWAGCWQPVAIDSAGEEVETSADLVCVIPGNETMVEIATVSAGEVVSRDTVNADGREIRGPRGTCVGTQVAEWSAEDTRVFLRSESICPGGTRREANGLISITPDGEWLDIRALNSGEAHGVRVQRYRAANIAADTPLPAEIRKLLRSRPDHMARVGAAQWISPDDVIEATQKVEQQVVQAWLVETGQSFFLKGRDLIRLADAGVPPATTDLMIALSYSRFFAVDRGKTYHPRPLDGDTAFRDPHGVPIYSIWDPGYYPGYVYGYGGYGRGFDGYYPGGVVIISGGRSRRSGDDGGKVVSGKGYSQRKQTGSSSTSSSSDRPREAGSTTSSSGSNSSSSTSSTSSSTPASSESSSSSSSGRTAKPRDP